MLFLLEVTVQNLYMSNQYIPYKSSFSKKILRTTLASTILFKSPVPFWDGGINSVTNVQLLLLLLLLNLLYFIFMSI